MSGEYFLAFVARTSVAVLAMLAACDRAPMGNSSPAKSTDEQLEILGDNCRDHAEPGPIDGVLCLFGPINESMLEIFDHSRGRVTTVVVDSPGGDTLSAAKIGLIIVEEEWDVLILGECSSACAHFVLLADQNAKIGRNAELYLHSLPIYRLFERAPCIDQVAQLDSSKSPSLCEAREARAEAVAHFSEIYAERRPKFHMLYDLYTESLESNAHLVDAFYSGGGRQNRVYLFLRAEEISMVSAAIVSDEFERRWSARPCKIAPSEIQLTLSRCDDVENSDRSMP